MTWAKLTGRTWLSHHFETPLPGPSADFWGEVDVWIPANTFTACGEDANHDLFGFTAEFIDFGNDNLRAQNVGTTLAPDWRWISNYGNLAATGPTPGSTHTIKFHYTSGTRFASVDWYVDGVLVVSDTAVNTFTQSNLFLNHFPEGCCCEIYYYTNVKLGSTDGGSDIFASDFSEGLGFWTRNRIFMPSALALVDAPVSAACATLTIRPPRGLPGDTITLTGTGFAPDSPLDFWLHNIQIESFSASSDGSGNVHATVTVPHTPTTGSFDPDFASLTDLAGNIGCATLGVCGPTEADGITTAPDPIVATGGVTDTNNLILDYIFHDGAHWVLWQDTSVDIANQTTFPPPTNHTMNATRISADGSSVMDYPIDSNYRWHFDGGNLNDDGRLASRPCAGSIFGVSAPVWSQISFFSAWEKPIYDVHFASDGTHLWVALLTQETVLYPWLDNLDACGPNPGAAAQFIPLATWTAGFTSFPTNTGTGRHIWNTQTDGAVNIYAPNAFPVTDAGEQDTGYWSIYVVAMFVFDGAAFNRIGEIQAKYCPGTTGGFAYGHAGILGVPQPLQHSQRGSLASRVSICASPNDPGRCHVVWSEGGDWGRQGLAADDCTPLVWDGGTQNRSYRVNYTTWSPTAKLSDTELWETHIDRTNWFFLNDYRAGGGDFQVGYTWPVQAEFAGLLQHDLRNDNQAGTPYLFAVWPVSVADCWIPISSNHGEVAFPPAYTDPHGHVFADNILLYGDTLRVYDLSGGVAVQMQALDLGTLATSNEEFNQIYTVGPPWQNPIGPADSILVNAAVDDSGCFGGQACSYGPQDKAFGLSLPYDDPELGIPVYLVHLPEGPRWAPESPDGRLVFNDGPQWATRNFYRVPCDMSAGFGYLDGERLVNFSVLKEPFGNPATGYQGFFYSSDFFSDEKNIWVPAPPLGAPFGFGFNGYQGEWFDRICLNQWKEFPVAWTPNVADYWLGSQCHGFHYDPAAASITTVAASSASPLPGDPLFAVTTQFICRGCRSCKCGTGVHIAHRF